jgi:hypothetical protein
MLFRLSRDGALPIFYVIAFAARAPALANGCNRGAHKRFILLGTRLSSAPPMHDGGTTV